MKRLGHEWGSLLGGRTTHPNRVVPGGFTEYPTEGELKTLRQRLVNLQPDLDATVQTVLSVADKLPSFERPTEYMALSSDKEYALYDGVIQTVMPDGKKQRWPVAKYKTCTNEYMVPSPPPSIQRTRWALTWPVRWPVSTTITTSCTRRPRSWPRL